MMTTERSSRRPDGIWIGAGILMMLCAVAAPLHAEIVTATTPSTTAHFFSSHPMIAGRVVTVNDHQLVVDTEHGERITLQVDSRTMAPRDLAPNMYVRTEFAALENCRFHADRVIAVRPGMPNERFQAYANTQESRELIASNEALRTASMRGPDGTMYTATTTNAAWRPNTPSRGTVMRAMPGTADHLDSTTPLISGTVMSVNDHRVVVETDQGQKVALVMDSRTLVPRDIAPGSMMRAEFREMQDGRYYAQRIRLVGKNSEYREQAYAYTRDSDVSSAGIIGDCESVVPTPGNSATSVAGDPHGDDRVSDRDATRDRDMSTDQGMSADHDKKKGSDEDRISANDEHGRDGTLPDTASRRPLFLILGLLGLASAGAITYLRMRTA